MRPETGWDVLQHEIRGEQAATIGRLSQELQAALDALKAANPDDPQRPRLVAAAGYALWHFIVQRDCSGFSRTTEHILKQYAIPPEVRAKMGIVRPR